MSDDGLLVLTGDDVAALLAGRKAEIADVVGRAYVPTTPARARCTLGLSPLSGQ
jgi:hypothetical protein